MSEETPPVLPQIGCFTFRLEKGQFDQNLVNSSFLIQKLILMPLPVNLISFRGIHFLVDVNFIENCQNGALKVKYCRIYKAFVCAHSDVSACGS